MIRLLKKAALLCQLRDSGSVMYVHVHSFALALASLHCNLFEQPRDGCRRDESFPIASSRFGGGFLHIPARKKAFCSLSMVKILGKMKMTMHVSCMFCLRDVLK